MLELLITYMTYLQWIWRFESTQLPVLVPILFIVQVPFYFIIYCS